MRIRVFSNRSKNFELIHQKKIRKRFVHHYNLNQILDKNVDKVQKGFYICQLESEEVNLNSYLIHSTCDSNLKKVSSLAIDHLTGG